MADESFCFRSWQPAPKSVAKPSQIHDVDIPNPAHRNRRHAQDHIHENVTQGCRKMATNSGPESGLDLEAMFQYTNQAGNVTTTSGPKSGLGSWPDSRAPLSHLHSVTEKRTTILGRFSTPKPRPFSVQRTQTETLSRELVRLSALKPRPLLIKFDGPNSRN